MPWLLARSASRRSAGSTADSSEGRDCGVLAVHLRRTRMPPCILQSAGCCDVWGSCTCAQRLCPQTHDGDTFPFSEGSPSRTPVCNHLKVLTFNRHHTVAACSIAGTACTSRRAGTARWPPPGAMRRRGGPEGAQGCLNASARQGAPARTLGRCSPPAAAGAPPQSCRCQRGCRNDARSARLSARTALALCSGRPGAAAHIRAEVMPMPLPCSGNCAENQQGPAVAVILDATVIKGSWCS